ncbi:MAG: hypothetical protein JWM68_2608 [Verrucomicrobiales bacterium]|nr:hypothetical protein [Verrucomicrobiales bacterium]
MKKSLVIAFVALSSVLGYSQGTVSFNNNVAFATPPSTTPGVGQVPANGHDNRLVYNTDNTTTLTGTNWAAQLYYKVGSGQAESSLGIISGDTFSKFRVGTTSSPGTWSGATKTFADVPIGTTATLQVRVWDGSLFGTYALAVAGNGVTGKSVTFNYTPQDTTLPATPIDASFMYGLQSFTVAVPEPSTIALGILGAASLLVVRRRKQ